MWPEESSEVFIQAMTTHDALLNHIMGCSFCNGRHDKYCETGRGLWVENHTDYVIRLESIEIRRTALAELRRNNPTWASVIESRVREIWHGLDDQQKNDYRVEQLCELFKPGKVER